MRIRGPLLLEERRNLPVRGPNCLPKKTLEKNPVPKIEATRESLFFKTLKLVGAKNKLETRRKLYNNVTQDPNKRVAAAKRQNPLCKEVKIKTSFEKKIVRKGIALKAIKATTKCRVLTGDLPTPKLRKS